MDGHFENGVRGLGVAVGFSKYFSMSHGFHYKIGLAEDVSLSLSLSVGGEKTGDIGELLG